MKKQLIAAAVASALAVPAMAQNVTISGYTELGFNRLATDNAATATTIAKGIFGSSRVTIGGSEDLGGGLKAGFRLEADLDPTSGKLGKNAPTSTTQDTIFSRGAEFNLSGGFGMIRLGKFDHQGGENTDGTTSNIVGNIALATGIASADTGNGTAEGVEIGSDRDGTIAYRTPSFLGGYVEVAHTLSDAITATNSADGVQGAVTSIYYEGSPVPGLSIRAGYATQKAVGAQTTSNKDADRTGLGASYNFGVFEAGIHYASATLISQSKIAETTVAAKMPLGNGLDIRGVYQDYDVSGTATGDFRETTVALAKALSKRTNVFAAYQTVNYGDATADTSRVYLGVGHSF